MAIIRPNDCSGIYRCIKCGNEENHVQGKFMEPCSKCTSNSLWRLLKRLNKKI